MSHMFDEETTFSFIARRLKEIQAQEWEKVRTPEKEPVIPGPDPEPTGENNDFYGDYC